MIMMVREQEIRAQGRAQGREEGRREQALATFNRLLALNIPEAQARALAFGDENEFAPPLTVPDAQPAKEGDMKT